MRTLKHVTSVFAALMLFHSCTTIDHTIEQCSINTVDAECYCRSYRISKEYVGPSSKPVIHPIEYCDKHISIPPKDYAVIYELMQRWRRFECPTYFD